MSTAVGVWARRRPSARSRASCQELRAVGGPSGVWEAHETGRKCTLCEAGSGNEFEFSQQNRCVMEVITSPPPSALVQCEFGADLRPWKTLLSRLQDSG